MIVFTLMRNFDAEHGSGAWVRRPAWSRVPWTFKTDSMLLFWIRRNPFMSNPCRGISVKVAIHLRNDSIKDRCRLSGTHHPVCFHSWNFWWENDLKTVKSHKILTGVCCVQICNNQNSCVWILWEILNCDSDPKFRTELGLFVESQFLASRLDSRINTLVLDEFVTI